MAKEKNMTRVLLALTLSVLLSGMARAEEPVQFADPRLKAAVENELWISDPTPTDMLGLTTLNARWEGISDLTGLGYAANLQVLRINNNEISDISVVATLSNLTVLDFHDNNVSDISVVSGLRYLSELAIRGNNITDLSPVAGLTDLKFLFASFNQISDISPLAGLTKLLYLNLDGNQISNLSPLSGLDDLPTVMLRDNQISDISPLAGLNGIRILDLHGNHISDISPLAGLGTLRTLHLSQNQVSDISPLAGLSSLSFLILSENQIHDISALSGLTSLDRLDLRDNPLNQEAFDVYLPLITANNPDLQLDHDGGSSVRRLSVSSTAGGSVIAPGEGTFTYDSGATVLLEARADPHFAFSHWSGTHATSQNPMVITMTRDHQIRAHFATAQVMIYVDDDAFADPGPGNMDISDPQENGTPEHPFDSIQEAIATASDGVSIIVRPGTYYE
ncbi:MAG: leucine-rich repeat domain-containing protein, partial [Sedimentisphaerales bacterium]|nr:leucine-rich repeat domain-containing protein [Sedimentisphaerales bacterium]